MPFVPANGVQLYYETYGHERPWQAPIVLIHGFPATGRADWGAIAPRLAEHYHVIVPDCRGHGQSQATGTYAFDELADDTAALIRALGYEQAHVIGHSNGGNVALVLLVEHPNIVQSCTIQAANAYVSPDLFERLPYTLDPERVARESPGWMHEMIALHGPAHGPDYWRDLLRLGLAGTLAGPNYAPEDLARVRKPVLVIQGARDTVNAPAGHAQFIAEHIPGAQLWLPDDTGHSVHQERPDEWLAHVLAFLAAV